MEEPVVLLPLTCLVGAGPDHPLRDRGPPARLALLAWPFLVVRVLLPRVEPFFLEDGLLPALGLAILFPKTIPPDVET